MKHNNNDPQWLVWLIVTIVLSLSAAVAFFYWDAYQTCKAGGGLMVRTLTGVECIRP